MTVQALHTILMILLVVQSIVLGCTTGKGMQKQPFYLRLILVFQPLATGAWILDIAYLGYWAYYSDTALLTAHIFTLYALTILIGRYERTLAQSCEDCPNFGGSD